MGKRVSAAKAGVDLEHRGVAIVVDDRLKAERAARAGERGCNPFRKVLKLRQSAGHAFFDFACAHSDPLMGDRGRSEEHTSELQSLMRISYAVFCLKKKNTLKNYAYNTDK